jgi:peptide/nickel transport system substrate-binding protein
LAGADLAQPHFAVGAKDAEGAGIFYAPLAAWEPNGNLVPVPAAEIPDIENGGLAADGMSVIWKLKKGVQWHDGQPFTADEVMFNWDYASDPATAATTIGSYQDVEVEKLDSFTVRVRFEKPTPGNFINSPERFVSKNTIWEFNVEKANQLLDEGGWKRGPDGIRAKGGKKLKLVFQTSINAPRQKTQAIGRL